MFLLYEYDIFWAFQIISSLIPILAFFISGVLAPTREGPEKLSSYESDIEPMGDACFNFRAYPNCWFSLCMAKRSIGMVLAPEYSDNKMKKEEKNDIEIVMNSIELSSLWPLLYGTSCCFIEFSSLIGSHFDFDHYGLVPRSSLRKVDLILIVGTVTMKMAPSLVRLYEKMPEPKYVISMGACTIFFVKD
ncbi:hypothetical protein MKX03_003690 [Papaver bracteatum]|nr:hypothetical protein MKX03_003690 [Papaver bracteatum]